MGKEGAVIVRVLRVLVHPGKEDEFERFVLGTGLPMVEATEGCTHVTAGKSRLTDPRPAVDKST